jgi:hypothetical protein
VPAPDDCFATKACAATPTIARSLPPRSERLTQLDRTAAWLLVCRPSSPTARLPLSNSARPKEKYGCLPEPPARMPLDRDTRSEVLASWTCPVFDDTWTLPVVSRGK